MNNRPIKTFFAAFVLTLCALALPLSFLLIEWNMQRTVYGRVEPGVSFSVVAGCPTLTATDGERVTAIPKPGQRVVYALLPAPVRAGWYLLRGEVEAAARLWEHIWPSMD